MELTEFLTAQLGGATRLAWCGPMDGRLERSWIEPIADLVELHDEDPADPSEREHVLGAAADGTTVLVLSGDTTLDRVLSPRRRAVLADRPAGARSAVIADAGRFDARALAEGLAEAGQQIGHLVRLDDSPLGTGAVGLSLHRVSTPGSLDATAAPSLVDTNEQRLQQSWSDEPAGSAAEESIPGARDVIRLERQRRREAQALARQLQSDLASSRTLLTSAKADLVRLRGSASVQLGRAIAAALDNPRKGLPALPGRVRTVVGDRRKRRAALLAHGTRSGAERPDGGSATRAGTRPSLPVAGGRRREFDLRLPAVSEVPDSPFRRHDGPSTMRIDVPYSFFVPLRLERDGLAGYEPETLAWWLALCDSAGPGVVWDIGANTGLFAALAAAATTRTVTAFEPTPGLSAWARALAVENGLTYVVEQMAASDVDGTATFFLSDSTDSSSSLAEGFRKSTHHLEVLTERLDTHQRRSGHVPAVIKVDTETTEPAVLRGAGPLIREHRPWILCEVLVNRGVEEPLMELAVEWGYRWYHLTEELPPPSPQTIQGDPTYTYFMYLLAPSDIDDELMSRVAAWRSALRVCTPDAPARS